MKPHSATSNGTAGQASSGTRRIFLTQRILWRLAAVAAFVSVCGCGSNSGGGSSAGPINPSAAAGKAIELYDKDGSGSLSEAELAASPGLLAALDHYDKDADRQISRDEIEQRLQSIVSNGTSFLTVNCRILQGGRPLAGAKVRFVPDEFLADALLPATGTTDTYGQFNPAVADEQLPDERKGVRLMQQGIYRVEVEHPSVKQPHKPLGCEIDELVRGGTDPVINL